MESDPILSTTKTSYSQQLVGGQDRMVKISSLLFYFQLDNKFLNKLCWWVWYRKKKIFQFFNRRTSFFGIHNFPTTWGILHTNKTCIVFINTNHCAWVLNPA